MQADRGALLAGAELLACVNRPDPADVARLRKGAAVIGFLRPLDEPEGLRAVPRRGRDGVRDGARPAHDARAGDGRALLDGDDRRLQGGPRRRGAAPEDVPAPHDGRGHGPARRRSSSWARASRASWRSPPRAASARTSRPTTSARPRARRSARSGARFLDVDLGGIQTQDAGGYAVELSPEALKRGRDLVAKHVEGRGPRRDDRAGPGPQGAPHARRGRRATG